MLFITFVSYIKKYWSVFLLVIGTVITYFLLRKQDNTFSEQLKKIQEIHENEIKKISEAHEEERAKNKENLEKLQLTLSIIQSKYDEAKQKLEVKKIKEIEIIVQEHGNDPNVLAQKLSEATGFKIILPE